MRYSVLYYSDLFFAKQLYGLGKKFLRIPPSTQSKFRQFITPSLYLLIFIKSFKSLNSLEELENLFEILLKSNFTKLQALCGVIAYYIERQAPAVTYVYSCGLGSVALKPHAFS